MSFASFLTDNVTLAQSLAGMGGLVLSRIVESDLSIIDDVDGAVDENGQAIPALIVYPGNGHYYRQSFPIETNDPETGQWAVVWHLHLPKDGVTGWLTRWRSLNAVIRTALMTPGALAASNRSVLDVRWGEEPPIDLRATQAPDGPEMFYTVVAEEW